MSCLVGRVGVRVGARARVGGRVLGWLGVGVHGCAGACVVCGGSDVAFTRACVCSETRCTRTWFKSVHHCSPSSASLTSD